MQKPKSRMIKSPHYLHKCITLCYDDTHAFVWGRVPGAPGVTTTIVREMAKATFGRDYTILTVREVEHAGTIMATTSATDEGKIIENSRRGRERSIQQLFCVMFKFRDELPVSELSEEEALYDN